MGGVEEVPDESDLAAELGELVKRGIKRTFRRTSGANGMRPLELPRLFEIVEELYPDLWSGVTEQRIEAIQSTVNRAVARLPERNVRTTPASYRDAAKFIYELVEVEPAVYEKIQEQQGYREYDRRIAFLSREWGFSKVTVGRGIQEIRIALAAALVSLVVEDSETEWAEADAQSLPVGNPDYVTRAALHRQFTEATQQGARLVVLLGQAGMGKTWLAKALVGDQAPTVEIVDGQLKLHDLQAAFSAVDLTRNDVIVDEPAAYLAALLNSAKAPEWVVLDNLESAADLSRLLPRDRKSRVVATCRIKSDEAPADCHYISVGAMETDEAEALVIQRLPKLSAGDARYFARALGAYPLALRHACTLYSLSSASVTAFCDELLHDTTVVTGQAKTSDATTLVKVVHRLVNKLANEDILAAHFVSSVSLLPLMGRPLPHTSFLEFYTWCLSDQPPKLHTARSLHVLKLYGLIDVAEDGEITMHALTQDIISRASLTRLLHIGAYVAKGVYTMLSANISFDMNESGAFAGVELDGRQIPIMASLLLIPYLIRCKAQGDEIREYLVKSLGSQYSPEHTRVAELFVSNIVGIYDQFPPHRLNPFPKVYTEWVKKNLPAPSEEFMAATGAEIAEMRRGRGL